VVSLPRGTRNEPSEARCRGSRERGRYASTILFAYPTQYREILGRGAFKTVYKAFNESEGLDVAWNQVRVNEILTTEEQKERLLKEIDMLQKMNHSNVIALYESWVDEENMTVNFITELFTAGSLRQ